MLHETREKTMSTACGVPVLASVLSQSGDVSAEHHYYYKTSHTPRLPKLAIVAELGDCTVPCPSIRIGAGGGFVQHKNGACIGRRCVSR